MNLWTTFTPQKVSWELTCVNTRGKAPTGNWQENIELIHASLNKLKRAGISGIRLVIYPSELTQDGKSFNWKPIDQILDLSAKNKMMVDLCIGPFQYPNYPGIYLPDRMLRFVFDNKDCLDAIPELWKFGISFLEAQIQRFGKDKRLHGFHLANEWPDRQGIKGKENIKKCVSLAFMLNVAEYLKVNTTKPISINTNIDAADKIKLVTAFSDLLNILGDRGSLGFDIYPSQEIWEKTPLRKTSRLIWNYSHSINSISKIFSDNKLYFAEVEAQPWGGGQSWYELINQEKDSNIKVINFYRSSLEKTIKEFIKGTNCQTISLWGSDFWLVADSMGINWPLAQIKQVVVWASFSSQV